MPVAGWYVDPSGSGKRYWDGAAWTNHVEALAPPPPPAPTPPPPPPPGPPMSPAPALATATAPAMARIYTAPPSQPEGPVARTGDWIGGVLLALIMPLVGLIAGIYYVAKGGPRGRCGWMCVALSAVAIVFYSSIIADERRGPTQQRPITTPAVPQGQPRTPARQPQLGQQA